MHHSVNMTNLAPLRGEGNADDQFVVTINVQ
jgi:hypothetical protein